MKLDIQNVVDGITAVRQKIGAEVIPWSSDVGWVSLETYGEIEGVDLKDIPICPDGTFEIEGRKVLAYIRDRVVRPPYELTLPKFHIADCQALQNARRDNRYAKYVVSIKTDGTFKIRILPKGDEHEYKLNVCKFCLCRLNYDKYNESNRQRKTEIHNNFSTKDFFEKYKTTNIVPPNRNADTDPTNDYPKNWITISAIKKQRKDFICEQCGINLKTSPHFLNVHHVNRRKDDNRPENLKVLCIACHADQGADHASIKCSREYGEFMRTYTRRDFQR